MYLLVATPKFMSDRSMFQQCEEPTRLVFTNLQDTTPPKDGVFCALTQRASGSLMPSKLQTLEEINSDAFIQAVLCV